MTLLLESPLVGAVGGGLLAVMLLGGFLNTGRRSLLAAAAAALLLGAGLVWLESLVVTDREQIEDQIHSLADDLVAGRHQQILAAIHPLAPEVRQRAEAELRRHQFSQADVKSNLQVELQPDRQPPRAVATFNVVAAIKQYPRPIPRFITLIFYRREDGLWRIVDYSHEPPQAGYQRRP